MVPDNLKPLSFTRNSGTSISNNGLLGIGVKLGIIVIIGPQMENIGSPSTYRHLRGEGNEAIRARIALLYRSGSDKKLARPPRLNGAISESLSSRNSPAPKTEACFLKCLRVILRGRLVNTYSIYGLDRIRCLLIELD